MQYKLSINVRPLLLNLLLWMGGVALLLLSKVMIEWVTGSTSDGGLELAMVLAAYLLLFLLNPIRAWIDRRLHKRARRAARHKPGAGPH